MDRVYRLESMPEGKNMFVPFGGILRIFFKKPPAQQFGQIIFFNGRLQGCLPVQAVIACTENGLSHIIDLVGFCGQKGDNKA